MGTIALCHSRAGADAVFHVSLRRCVSDGINILQHVGSRGWDVDLMPMEVLLSFLTSQANPAMLFKYPHCLQ